MSKADEMFQKLGYKRLSKKYNKNMILYENENMLKDYKIIIYFSLTDKKIQFSPYYRYSMQELQAINEKVKELRVDRKIREER